MFLSILRLNTSSEDGKIIAAQCTFQSVKKWCIYRFILFGPEESGQLGC